MHPGYTIEKRVVSIKAAHPLTNDPGVIEPNQLLVKNLVLQLKSLMEAIAEHDQEIKRRYNDCTDRPEGGLLFFNSASVPEM